MAKPGFLRSSRKPKRKSRQILFMPESLNSWSWSYLESSKQTLRVMPRLNIERKRPKKCSVAS